MEIIKLTEQDKGSVLGLFKEVTKDLRKNGIDQWDRFYPNRIVVGKDLKQQHLYGVKEGGRVIAVVTVNNEQSSEYGGIHWDRTADRAACIHRLAVHPEYQGKGLGKKLLLLAEKLASEQGSTSIRLDVYSHNPSAISMYRNMGYSERGEIFFPLRKEPYLCMEKVLEIL